MHVNSQAPLTQAFVYQEVCRQPLAHDPQCELDVRRSAQLVPHWVCPTGQVATQPDVEQN
jgi:hypothetical protein